MKCHSEFIKIISNNKKNNTNHALYLKTYYNLGRFVPYIAHAIQCLKKKIDTVLISLFFIYKQ